jgi:hypothetical protein
MQKFKKKIESGFLLAQKTFKGKFKKFIKKSESWLAESKHHKPPTPDIPVQSRPSTNHFLRIAASKDPYPIWAEPEAWTCEEKHTAGSAGTQSLHAK